MGKIAIPGGKRRRLRHVGPSHWDGWDGEEKAPTSENHALDVGDCKIIDGDGQVEYEDDNFEGARAHQLTDFIKPHEEGPNKGA